MSRIKALQKQVHSVLEIIENADKRAKAIAHLHGVALAVHKWTREHVFHHDKHYTSHGLKRVGAVIITFHFAAFCWIFFRNHTFEASWTMITKIITEFHPEVLTQVISGYWAVMGMILFGYVTHFIPDRWNEQCVAVIRRGGVVAGALLIAAVIYVVIQVKSSEIQPFIYFQF